MGITSIAALAGGFLSLIVLFILLGVVVIIVVGSRAEPDPSGRRPFAVYYFAVSFIAVFVLLFSTYAVVASLMSLAGEDGQSGDVVARSVVLALLVAIFAGVGLAIHLRRGLALARHGHNPLDPSLRVAQTYVAAVSFLVMLIGLASGIAAIYAVFRAAGPGVFNPGGTRAGALRTLVDTIYLVAASLLLLTAHFRLAPPYLRPSGGTSWRGPKIGRRRPATGSPGGPYAGGQPGPGGYGGQPGVGQPGPAPYAGGQPGPGGYAQPAPSPYTGTQPGAAPYTGTQPGAAPYTGTQPAAARYPGGQPAAPQPGRPYDGQPGAPAAYQPQAPPATPAVPGQQGPQPPPAVPGQQGPQPPPPASSPASPPGQPPGSAGIPSSGGPAPFSPPEAPVPPAFHQWAARRSEGQAWPVQSPARPPVPPPPPPPLQPATAPDPTPPPDEPPSGGGWSPSDAASTEQSTSDPPRESPPADPPGSGGAWTE